MSNLQVESETRDRIARKLSTEFGAEIRAALEDDSVTEIMLNDDGSLWIESAGNFIHKGELSAMQAQSILNTVASLHNDVLNRDSPQLETELPNGDRINASIPPVVGRPSFTLRKHSRHPLALQDWVDQGALTLEQQNEIEHAVVNRKNILVSGGTGSGKTTFLNSIFQFMSESCANQRAIVIEATPELRRPIPNTLMLRTAPNTQMPALLWQTLGSRPDRIVIGEIRGGEALPALKLLQTGHRGGVCTVHADSATHARLRLLQMCAEATVGGNAQLLEPTVDAALDLVIQIAKDDQDRRRVTELRWFSSNSP